MIDTTTSQPLKVSTDGGAGPYIMLPIVQLDSVTTALDASEVKYWVDEEAISSDGKPEIAVINLGIGTDPTRIQGILDGIT